MTFKEIEWREGPHSTEGYVGGRHLFSFLFDPFVEKGKKAEFKYSLHTFLPGYRKMKYKMEDPVSCKEKAVKVLEEWFEKFIVSAETGILEKSPTLPLLENIEVAISASGEELETCYCEAGKCPKFGYLKYAGQTTCIGWIVHCPDCGLFYGIFHSPQEMAKEWNGFSTWKKRLPLHSRNINSSERNKK